MPKGFEMADMEKHADCKDECQQAVDYGVWPERSCSPECVWLRQERRLQEVKDAIGETVARVVRASSGAKEDQCGS